MEQYVTFTFFHMWHISIIAIHIGMIVGSAGCHTEGPVFESQEGMDVY